MMNRNKIFIFVFILLATLSIVNAVPPQLRKRVTIFEPCSGGFPPISVTEIDPDPLIPGAKGEFHFSGKIAKTIPTGSTLTSYFLNTDAGNADIIGKIWAEVCTPKGIFECPFPAKTPFIGILGGTVIADLPKSYAILVALEDPNKEILGCTRAFVGGAQPLPATPSAAGTPTPKAPASPPPASPPPAPPPPAPAPAPTSSAPSGGSGKGAGGIQDSLIISGLLSL